MNEKLKNVLQFIHDEEFVTLNTIAQHFGVSKNTARKYLSQLRKEFIVFNYSMGGYYIDNQKENNGKS